MNFKLPRPSRRISLTLIGTVFLVLALNAVASTVLALPSSDEVINGTIAVDETAVVGANVTLVRLGQMGDRVVNWTVTDESGWYSFGGLASINDYKIQVSFGDVQHAKYYRLGMYNETDFNFDGRIEANVRGVDESELEGLEVGLYNLLGESEVNATTDVSGVVVFENVDSLDTYYVALSYKGLLFSAVAELEGSTTSQPTIEVLEATTSDEDFKITFQHVIVLGEDDAFSVRETLSAQNAGGKVFNTSWLRGSIPVEAYDVTHDTMDCCINFYETGDYAFDPMTPLYPGDSSQLSLNYFIEKEPNHVIEKKIVYDTDRMFVLVQKTDRTTAEAISGVTSLGVESMGEGEYYLFEGTSLLAGESVQIRVTTEIPLIQRLSDYGSLVEAFPFAIPLVMVLGFFVYQRLSDREGDEYEDDWDDEDWDEDEWDEDDWDDDEDSDDQDLE